MALTTSQRTLAVAGALLVASAAMFGFRAGRAQAEPTSVAVVDLFKLMNGLEEWKEYDAQLSEMAASFQEEINAMSQEVQRQRDELQGLNLSRDEEVSRLVDLRVQEDAIKQKRGSLSFRLDYNENIRMVDLYQKVSTAIAAYAQEAGYDLVLIRSDVSSFGDLPDAAGVQPQQLRELMVLRQTIYVSDAVDITEQLRLKMNNERNLEP